MGTERWEVVLEGQALPEATARNNKLAFSNSNKQQSSGERRDAADKETRSRTRDGFTGSQPGPGRAKPVTDLY